MTIGLDKANIAHKLIIDRSYQLEIVKGLKKELSLADSIIVLQRSRMYSLEQYIEKSKQHIAESDKRIQFLNRKLFRIRLKNTVIPVTITAGAVYLIYKEIKK